MIGKAIAAVVVIVFLVPAAAFLVLTGPALIGWGIYEAVIGHFTDAAMWAVMGVMAGWFALWLAPGFFDAITPGYEESWFW